MARNEDEVLLEEYVKRRVHQPWHSSFVSARIPEPHQNLSQFSKKKGSVKSKIRQDLLQKKLDRNKYVSRVEKANKLIFEPMQSSRNHQATKTAPHSKHR